jgi:predicted homoserine dehydrogenase-like protein
MKKSARMTIDDPLRVGIVGSGNKGSALAAAVAHMNRLRGEDILG